MRTAHAVVLPPELRTGPFTRAQAIAAGIDDHELKSPAVRKLHTGVYLAAGLPVDHATRCRAALLRAPEGSAIGGLAALRLWNVMIPRRLEPTTTIDVVLPQRIGWTGTKGIRAIRPVREIRCIGQIVDPADVLAILARDCTWIELVEIGDGLVRRIRPLTTIEELRAAVVRATGGWGYRDLERAIDWIRPGVDSIPETDLRLAIIAAGLPEPEVNPPVSLGDVVLHPDLAYVEHKIAIEYDGIQYHRGDDLTRQRDNQRIRRFQSRGWAVVVATATDIEDPRRLIVDLGDVLAARGNGQRQRRPFRLATHGKS